MVIVLSQFHSKWFQTPLHFYFLCLGYSYLAEQLYPTQILTFPKPSSNHSYLYTYTAGIPNERMKGGLEHACFHVLIGRFWEDKMMAGFHSIVLLMDHHWCHAKMGTTPPFLSTLLDHHASLSLSLPLQITFNRNKPTFPHHTSKFSYLLISWR